MTDFTLLLEVQQHAVRLEPPVWSCRWVVQEEQVLRKRAQAGQPAKATYTHSLTCEAIADSLTHTSPASLAVLTDSTTAFLAL